MDNEAIVTALKGLDTQASLLAGDAVRHSLSLDEAYSNRFRIKKPADVVIVWLGQIRTECEEMTGVKVYVYREHMPK